MSRPPHVYALVVTSGERAALLRLAEQHGFGCARRTGGEEDLARRVRVDTAGRLHTKFNLMEELQKIRRVAAKANPDHPVGWPIPVHVVANLPGVQLPQEGSYTIDVLLNNQHLGSENLRVRLVSQTV